MANYEYNTNSGIVVPNTADIKSDVEQEYKTALQKEDLDTSESTPQGRLIEAETIARKRTIENMALLANMFNPQQSYGIFLDSIAALFGIDRTGATATRVRCRLSGTPNTIIPAGSQVKDSSGNIYYLENEVDIDVEGSVSGIFLCTEKGAIECPAGAITQIVTAISGWNGVINEVDGETGFEGQSDNELRQSLPTKQYQGRAIKESIKSAILNVENVKSCVVKDNPTASSITIENVRGVHARDLTLPAHSLYICVDGGNVDDVAQAIYDTRSLGCAYASSNNETTIGEGTEAEDVYFDNLDEDGGGYTVPITVNITVKTGATTDITDAVKAAIIAYANNEIPTVDGLKLGTNVYGSEIACAVNAKIPEVIIVGVSVTTDGVVSGSWVPISINEKATIAAADINVTQEAR